MEYRRLGSSGLQLSALSFGAWVTFGNRVGRSEARNLIALAYDRGINFFDNAETYAAGEAERVMGDVLADLRLPRDAWCVSSKVYFGAVRDPRPTQRGLSRKHVIEACHQALTRLRVDYLDLYFCHRPDPGYADRGNRRGDGSPRAPGQGAVLGHQRMAGGRDPDRTSHRAREPPAAPQMEQPQYNLFHRERVEVEYAPLYKELGLGTTTWSPLASGLLTGKYNDGIPAGSRLDTPGYEWLQRNILEGDGPARIAQGETPRRDRARAWCAACAARDCVVPEESARVDGDARRDEGRSSSRRISARSKSSRSLAMRKWPVSRRRWLSCGSSFSRWRSARVEGG